MRLRSSGFTWREIAEALGYSDTGNAYRDFKRAIQERPGEAVDDLRERSNEALGLVLRGHLNKARSGDARSAEVVIKAVATHARINGYEAPQVLEHTGKDGGPIETSDLRDELLSRLARIAAVGAKREDPPQPH